MKTNEICQIFGINRETIRFYRNQHLIRPLRNENGYFSYSINDLACLFFIFSKQRRFKTPLNNIYHNPGESFQIQMQDCQKAIVKIDYEIEHLMRLKEQLNRRLNYIQTIQNSYYVIQEFEESTPLIYQEVDHKDFSSQCIDELNSLGFPYQSIVIDKEDFNKAVMKTHYAVGVNNYSLQKAKDLKHTYQTIASNQKGFRFTLILTDLNHVDGSHFNRVKEFLSENHYTLKENITSTILDINQVNDHFEYIVLFRFIVCKRES